MSRNVLSAVLAGLLVAACGGQAPSSTITGNESFVTIGKSGADAAAAASTSDSFYLAINRKELGQKYFLSAYLTQYFPGAVAYGAARSLGTRVVSFKVQNGKLFVFDVADTHKDSNTFDPSLIVDAYPLVTGVLSGDQAKNFVVFDPAAGLNQFGVVADAFAGGSQPVHFKTELSYVQRFRAITDGVTFEQVFTGYADAGDPNSWILGENNAFRGSGTLGIALRKYTEGKGFTPGQISQDGEFFFRSDLKLVPNTGSPTQTAAKWNIQPGMKPIKWLISDKINNLKSDPVLGQYDVQGALTKAIENWNQVFGFQVLQAGMATASDSYGDDDTNYVLWDEDPSFGAAFANWRSNPNTGEIRGASVYMNVGWVQIADQIFADDAAHAVRADGVPTLLLRPVKAQPKIPTLVWEGLRSEALCALWAPDYRAADEIAWNAGLTQSSMTKKQKVEAFLTHVLLHEIGHTLGLRHNFKGSLVPPSSSVMDYLTNEDSLQVTVPGAYDTAAVQLLYGISKASPAQPFCTDEDVGADTNCNRFDTGAQPLQTSFIPYYTQVMTAFLAGQIGSPPNVSLNKVLGFVRAGSPADMQAAWTATIANVKVPVAADALKADPNLGRRIDFASRRILGRLFIDPAGARGDYYFDPSPYSPIAPQILAELQGNLANADGIRSFTTRRLTVDILKKMQTSQAYNALRGTRDAIASQRAGLSGDQAALTDDLLSRIDAALHPYFN